MSARPVILFIEEKLVGKTLQRIPAFAKVSFVVDDASRERTKKIVKNWKKEDSKIVYPEPRGPRVLHVGELVLWYGMFAPCGRFLGTTGFARGAPSSF